MTKPCIITVAITGSVPRKEHNPAVPITIAEQVESTQAAFEAGATIGWYRYVGDRGRVVGIDHFGASASAETLFREFGITAENVAAAARDSILAAGRD